MANKNKNHHSINRRDFLKNTSLATGAMLIGPSIPALANISESEIINVTLDDFQRKDNLYHGDQWESMNPGYWQIKNNTLRRRLKNVGERARRTGFPYHYETHGKGEGTKMNVDYDPSLPLGVIWNRHWKIGENYTATLSGTIHELTPQIPGDGDDGSWRMYQKGNGVAGIALGGNTQFESFYPNKNACLMVVIKDDHTFGIVKHTNWDLPEVEKGVSVSLKPLEKDDHFQIKVKVSKKGENVEMNATLTINDKDKYELVYKITNPHEVTGYLGIAARGLMDFSVNEINLQTSKKHQLQVETNECHNCYALGDTLRKENGQWIVRFVSIFRNEGKQASIRIADEPNPARGWESVPKAGNGEIVSNDFRRNTAIIDVVLPFDPSEKTMYYTVWKDDVNVTSDPRIGTAAVGPGTGLVGDVPSKGNYVGRLPQLTAPYKLCGLSCHAIHGSRPNLPDSGRWQSFHVHDQPTPGAYQHLEAYNFQIMMWEDDIWYMELLLYPPSTDDAYKIVTTSICGPTSRWQMMRHWNVLNPGDHDHGMDDIKGPEQLAIRKHKDLGQDSAYLIRNFQIVSHLMTGKENPSGTDNPKRWRKWKMPNKDFTLMIMDSRLWRSSQDTHIWDDEGWGHKENLYARTDPTRSLLGEEQFAWLQENIHTDTSEIICLTGINALHTIWKGTYWGDGEGRFGQFGDRDRVAADYAGWVAAGVDRVLELLGSRDGIVSVYGDVHNGSIIKNTTHNLYECSFGPIGRSGGREVIEGFGPKMKDFDGRSVEAIALYHEKYDNVLLQKKEGPFYWNFLEMAFDPQASENNINFSIRNLIDAPTDEYRGGASLSEKTSQTGRHITSKLPAFKTLAHADVIFLRENGIPIRGCRSTATGSVKIEGLVGIKSGEHIMMLASDGMETQSQLLRTV